MAVWLSRLNPDLMTMVRPFRDGMQAHIQNDGTLCNKRGQTGLCDAPKQLSMMFSDMLIDAL